MSNFKNTAEMTIGELAKAAGVHVETIRYYQKRGLLAVPVKPKQGYMRYSTSVLAQIAFIKSAQHLNFSLNEIKELFELSAVKVDKARVREVAQQRLQEVRLTKLHLIQVERTLNQWLKNCERSGEQEVCPIIDNIKNTAERIKS